MSTITSQITDNSTFCSTVCSDRQQSKYQSSTLHALCEGRTSVTGLFPSQRASDAQSFHRPDVYVNKRDKPSRVSHGASAVTWKSIHSEWATHWLFTLFNKAVVYVVWKQYSSATISKFHLVDKFSKFISWMWRNFFKDLLDNNIDHWET